MSRENLDIVFGVSEFTVSLSIICILAQVTDFEIGHFLNFLTTRVRSCGMSSCSTHRPLPTYQISLKSEKLFVDRLADTETDFIR